MRAYSLRLDQISIKDPFWSKHVDLVRNVILPYQWDAINDQVEDAQPSHCLENFRIAAGRTNGAFYGMPFQDTDAAKWLEAVGFTLSCYKDEKLEKTADEVIDLIAEAQCEDGYINTFYTLTDPDGRWSDLCEGHELYTAGHLMEAAAAYYLGTGKRKFLDVMCRFADLIIETFGNEEGKIHGYPGHEEVEIGLIKLYQVTGEKKYLDQAKYFIDARGVGENYFMKELARPGFKRIFPEFRDYSPEYAQSHLPVRNQTTAEGHAVRAVYLYSAMADLAEAYGDEQLKKACETIWNNIVRRRMYLTGGIGSSGHLERFTTDYDLPNTSNYSESCASIGLAMFGLRMNQITGEAKYMDVVERALYNTVLAGIALDGKSFFYVNPLEVWPPACMPGTSLAHVKNIRQKWFGVACCPPNIARTLASLGQYIYGVEEDAKALYLNLFISNEADLPFKDAEGVNTKVQVETKFPYEGEIRVCVKNVPTEGMDLYVRIPDYAREFAVVMDEDGACKDGSFAAERTGMGSGREASSQVGEDIGKGYCKIHLTKDTKLLVTFEMPPHYVYANTNVRADAGKAAIVRGPLVYCLEECDNGPLLPEIIADVNAPLCLKDSQLFSGCKIICGSGRNLVRKGDAQEDSLLYCETAPESEPVTFTAIPYPYWNNRGVGEMLVWLRAEL